MRTGQGIQITHYRIEPRLHVRGPYVLESIKRMYVLVKECRSHITESNHDCMGEDYRFLNRSNGCMGWSRNADHTLPNLNTTIWKRIICSGIDKSDVRTDQGMQNTHYRIEPRLLGRQSFALKSTKWMYSLVKECKSHITDSKHDCMGGDHMYGIDKTDVRTDQGMQITRYRI